MLSRLTYTFRETWASFRRNTTLTVAAVITSAVSLLIFGLTLLMQRGFDNLLVAWEGDVEMIVYLNSGATEEQRGVIQNALDSQTQLIDDFSYCDTSCSLAEAQRLLAGDPGDAGAARRDEHPHAVQGRPDRCHRRRRVAPAARRLT